MKVTRPPADAVAPINGGLIQTGGSVYNNCHVNKMNLKNLQCTISWDEDEIEKLVSLNSLSTVHCTSNLMV